MALNRHPARRWRKKKRLYDLQNGVCYWCPKRMMLARWKQKRNPPDNLATFEHLDPRGSSARGTHPQGIRRIVLACRKCNNDRGNEVDDEQ